MPTPSSKVINYNVKRGGYPATVFDKELAPDGGRLTECPVCDSPPARSCKHFELAPGGERIKQTWIMLSCSKGHRWRVAQ